MVKLTFLGTADQISSESRNHTSILLVNNEENILIDCGEGTQRQFRKADLNPCKVTRILITHWHGDHVLGLIGILSTLAVSGYNKTLFIYGPRGIKENMQNLFYAFPFKKTYEIIIEEVSGKFFENENFYLEAEKMQHGINTNAYSFTKIGKKRIDKDKMKKLGLPEGPLMRDLKEGKDIVFEGKKYKSKDLTFQEEDLKISFVLDTLNNENIIPFVKNSNLLVSECNFSKNDIDKAREHFHLTSVDVGKIAKKAKVEKLILTHISQRYEKCPKLILEEVKENFSNVVFAKDLDSFEVGK